MIKYDFGALVLTADEVIVITAGEQGPRGPAGPPGSGSGGGGNYLEYLFGSPTQVVIINHMFGRRPNVQILSPGSMLLSGEVTHFSVDQVRLSFSLPQAGLAVLTA